MKKNLDKNKVLKREPDMILEYPSGLCGVVFFVGLLLFIILTS